MAVSSFRIPPRPPFRALATAAICALAGAVVLVVAISNSWPIAAAIVGIVLLAAGMALCGAALLAMRSHVVTLTLTDDGYEVAGAGQKQSGRWDAVTRVTATDSGDRITIEEKDRKVVLAFYGQDKRTSEAIAEVIAHKLRTLNP